MNPSPLPTQSEVNSDRANGTRFRAWIAAIFIVAAAVRMIDVWRPIDGSIRESWREADTGAIARNFYREGMNIFEPRIDWRGDGPGFVESEFPIYPWMVACLYHLFGYHEEILRVVSYIISLACCGMFLRLAGRLLPRSAIPVSFAIFALNPMAVRLANSVQPEPLMFLMYLIAIDAFIRWTDDQKPRHYAIALIATTLAILAKVTAAHVGVLFACLCLRRFGWSVLKRFDVWAFAIVSLGVPFLWYWHAHEIWLEYGNSLGISNEAYVRISSGSFLLSVWDTIPGVLSIQSLQVWMGAGLLLGMFGLRATRRLPSTEPLQFWVLALIAYFLITGRTTGESWAAYYHIVSVPAACMLMGLGFKTFFRGRVGIEVRAVAWCVIAAGVAAFVAWTHLDTLERQAAAMFVVGAVAAVAGLSARMLDDVTPVPSIQSMRFFASLPMMACLMMVAALEVREIRSEAHPHHLEPAYRSAVAFTRHVPEGELIIASGPSEWDQHGLLRAANPSYYFFWMDRKGFTLHDDQQTPEHLSELQRRGGHYFVAERESLAAAPELEQYLRQSCETLEETEHAILFDLDGLTPPIVNEPQLTLQCPTN